MPRRAEGEPEILNIPKILGGVVAATIGILESLISLFSPHAHLFI